MIDTLYILRGKSITVFISGDYEVLCKLYGLSGATGIKSNDLATAPLTKNSSGRHCCLWCRIEHKDLKKAPILRDMQPEQRDLSTLAAAHTEFQTKGKGNLNVAKKYFNVISKPFFDIPLNQVVNRMWVLQLY